MRTGHRYRTSACAFVYVCASLPAYSYGFVCRCCFFVCGVYAHTLNTLLQAPRSPHTFCSGWKITIALASLIYTHTNKHTHTRRVSSVGVRTICTDDLIGTHTHVAVCGLAQEPPCVLHLLSLFYACACVCVAGAGSVAEEMN